MENLRKVPIIKKDKRFPKKKKILQEKISSRKIRRKKKCRCWLCAEGHYANKCQKKEKRTSKAMLFEEYE
jgi:hypothetical protein